jgi:pyridoxamine 5'-phosphate oxidase
MSLWTPPPDDAPRRLADLRVTYDLGTLAPEDLPGAPLAAFHGWFAEAEAAGLPEPNAMVVSTATTAGAPSSRTVLLKDADARGFVFYTNLTSRKGRELAENPQASLVFPWFAIHRQVTVVGSAELIGRDEVETYFRSRPRGSQLGAWASEQSTVIDGRDALEARYAELTEQYGEEGEITTGCVSVRPCRRPISPMPGAGCSSASRRDSAVAQVERHEGIEGHALLLGLLAKFLSQRLRNLDRELDQLVLGRRAQGVGG